MAKEQRIEEIRTVAQEKMKENCRVHQPAFCNCTIDECKRTACWYFEADTLAHQIYDALFPQGDDEGFAKSPYEERANKEWVMRSRTNHYKSRDKAFNEGAKAQRDLTRQERLDRPKIICLCGSTRFTNEMLKLTWKFHLEGVVAIGWCVLPSNHSPDGSEIDHHLAEKEGVADLLDELHLRKIDLADEVFVVNVGGYVGEGTRREIAYVKKVGKPIKYLEAVNG